MASKKQASDSPTQSVGETNNSNNGHVIVTPDSNFGNFGYRITCPTEHEIAPILAHILAEGVLHTAQRGPASRTEKRLVGYTKREDMGSSWERGDIAYSDETARRFESILAEEVKRDKHSVGLVVTVNAWEYTPSAPERKYAQAQQTLREATKRGRQSVEKLAKNVGFEADFEYLNVDNVDFLVAIDAELVRRRESML